MELSDHPPEGEPAAVPASVPAPRAAAPSVSMEPLAAPNPGALRAPDPRPAVWPAFVGFGAALGVGQVVGVIVLGAMFAWHLSATGASFSEPASLLRGLPAFITSPAVIVAATAASALTLVGTSLVGARLARTPVSVRLRLGPSNIGVWKTALAALGAVAVSWLFGTLISLLHLDGIGLLGLLGNAFEKASPGVLVLSFLFVGIAAPIGEEMFFRGFMQTRLAQRWSRWGAIAMTAAAFGFMHMDPIQGPFAMLVGLYLGWLTERTGSIRPAIVAHATNNCLSVVMTRYARGEVSKSAEVGQLVASAVVLGAAILVLRSGQKQAPAAH